jgi:hypothetical protein
MRSFIAQRGWKLAIAAGLASLGSAASASDWLIQTYMDNGQITNYTKADGLINGYKLVSGFPVSSSYTATNVQDNNGGGAFGVGTQIVGLPGAPTDSDDFVFVGTGTVTVNTAGSYVFFTNTDDGSRVRGSVNGGPTSQIITDNVLSGPHDVPSAAIALPAGASVAFNWMWFERGGGAEGSLSYTRDGGTRVLLSDNSQGLSLSGGAYTGTLYKSDTSTNTTLGTNGLATSHTLVADPTKLFASAHAPTFNIVNTGGDGHFGGGVQPPGIQGEDINDYVVKGTGFLKVVTGGTYRFASLSDDGAEMILKDPTGTTTLVSIIDDTYHGAGDPGDIKLSDPVTLAPGFYPLSYLYFEAGGGSSGELFLADPLTGAPIALVGDTANGGLEVVQSIPSKPNG